MELLLSASDISLRPIGKEDEEILYAIYASTRESEMELVEGWSDEQKEHFLRQQFYAQHNYYLEYYPNAAFWVIEHNHEVVGRLYLRVTQEVRIVDITLLPDRRNAGIGGQLLKDILEAAERENKNVSIHVECNNPALQLYERLGFKVVKEVSGGVYYFMERVPQGMNHS